MIRTSVVARVFVSVAAVGFCFPQPLLAAANLPPCTADVTLTAGGVLQGQVIDCQGAPLAKIPVSLRDRDRQSSGTVTDQYGRFAVGNLRGGVYQIVAGGGYASYRLWSPGTAPPSAEQTALLVASQDVVRGQWCGRSGRRCCPGWGAVTFWMSNPWIVAGIAATAISIPVAINNSEDTPTSP